MSKANYHDAVSMAYAKSMMELAAESGKEAAIGAELESIGQILTDNPNFVLYLNDPAISLQERAGKLKTIFGGRVSPLIVNLLGVMADKRRLAHLGGVIGAYDALLEEKLGKIEVDVTVATQLSSSALDEVRELVSKALKKDAVVHQYVDESIIGGVILKVGDRLIDGSVRTQLQQMKEKLLMARGK